MNGRSPAHTEMRERLERLARRLAPQSRLLRAWRLEGGVSADVTALEMALLDGSTRKLIVRHHGPADRARNPHIAADEFKLLQILQSSGLAVPPPCYLDQSGEVFPTPYLVVEYVEGETQFSPANKIDFIRQMAAYLARIHRINPRNSELSFLPKQIDETGKWPTELDESLGEGRIRAALAQASPPPQLNEPVLLHGDYWPGNILWRAGRLAAVIDWEDAHLGDPLVDLANSRLELLWAFGAEAMQRFTHEYQLRTSVDWASLPYWDLMAALRPAGKISEWASDASIEKRMREGHRLFVNQALKQLSDMKVARAAATKPHHQSF